jgi:magnesium-transporting ATPase (P-type)
MTGEEFASKVGGVKRVIGKDGKEKWQVGDKKAFKNIADNLKVLARSTPQEKFALVVGL